MKRTTVKLEVEVEGPTVNGMDLAYQMTRDYAEFKGEYPEESFRVVSVQVLSEDR